MIIKCLSVYLYKYNRYSIDNLIISKVFFNMGNLLVAIRGI